MKKYLKVGLLVMAGLVSNSFADVIYSQPFYNANPGKTMDEFGWSTLNETTTGLVENATFTNKMAIAVGGGGGAPVVDAIDAIWPAGFATPRVGGYPYFNTNNPEHPDFPTDSYCLTYTSISTVLGIDEVGKLSLDQRADGVDSVIRFTVKIGTNWYASAENFGGSGGVTNGNNAVWSLKEMDPEDFTAAANWLEISFGTTDIIVGAAPASDLSGDVDAYGVLLNTGVDPVPGDHVRFDNFQVHDQIEPPEPPSYDLLYSQPFYRSLDGLSPVTNWGWTTLIESIAGVVENPSYLTAPTTVDGIATGAGGADVGVFNAVSPTNDVPGTTGYGFVATRQNSDYAGASALMYTVIPTNTTVAGLQQLRVDQRADNTDAVIRFAIQIGSQWYASAEDFGGANGSFVVKEMQESDFSAVTNWLELTVTASEITVESSAPGAPLSGTISAYGLYLDAGETPLAGDHVRFDNFQVYGGASTTPPGGTQPYIVSYGMSSGISSLSFTGGVSEAYVILSSIDMSSGFATTVTPTSVSIGSQAGAVITTDGSGAAAAAFNSSEDVEFYIVEVSQ